MDMTFVFNSASVFICSQGLNYLPEIVPVGFTGVVGPVPNKWEATGFPAFSLAFFLLGPSPGGNGGQPFTVNLQIKVLIEPTPVGLSVSSHLTNR